MYTQTPYRKLILVIIISLILAGCASQGSDSNTSSQTTPEEKNTVTPTVKTKNPEEVTTPQDQLVLEDSASPLSPGAIDRVFLISNQGEKELPASDIEIDIYQHGELIDSLKYDSYSQRFQGENMRSLPFSNGLIDPGDSVLITEMSGFDIESDSVVVVKITQAGKDHLILDGEIRVI